MSPFSKLTFSFWVIVSPTSYILSLPSDENLGSLGVCYMIVISSSPSSSFPSPFFPPPPPLLFLPFLLFPLLHLPSSPITPSPSPKMGRLILEAVDLRSLLLFLSQLPFLFSLPLHSPPFFLFFCGMERIIGRDPQRLLDGLTWVALSKACGFSRRHRGDGIVSQLCWHGCKRSGKPVHLSRNAAGKVLGGPRRKHCSELCILGFRISLHTLSSLQPVRICRPSCKPIWIIWEQVICFALMGPNPSCNCVTLCLGQ